MTHLVPRVVYVRGDDWNGLYVDRKLVLEGHSFRVEDICECVGVVVKTVHPDLTWLNNRDNLPIHLENVVLTEEARSDAEP